MRNPCKLYGLCIITFLHSKSVFALSSQFETWKISNLLLDTNITISIR